MLFCSAVVPENEFTHPIRLRHLRPSPLRISLRHSVAPLVEETTGYASWYGHPYHGRRTSNGETYDMNTMTAAHRTLPFDTVVKVSNLSNGKAVTVRINDRGPFVKDRIIDLSYLAAKQIDLVGPGTARVSLEILKVVPNPFPLAIQVASFKEEVGAKKLQRI